MRKIKTLLLVFGVGFATILSTPSWAQNDLEFDKFRISLGWFGPSADTSVRLDATSGIFGTSIKLEDDLGVSKKESLFRIDGYWRPKKRHRIDFGYYDFERNGVRTISKTINFRDLTFVFNTQITSRFDLKIIKLAYTYLVVAKQKTTVGLSLGFNISEIGVGLSALDGVLSDFASTSIPLPVVGVNATHDLGSKFTLEAEIQFFYIDIGSADGSLFDGRVVLTYRINKNFGIGVGYNYFTVKASKTTLLFKGRVKFNYDGAQVFLNVFF